MWSALLLWWKLVAFLKRMHANGDERVPSAVLQDGAFYRDGEIRNILLDIPKGEPRSSAMCATCPALSDDVKHNAKSP